jgi:hypothetical protein
MKHLLTTTSLAFLISSMAFGQTVNRIARSKEQALALNNEWANAITKGDSLTLDRLFADDMIVTSGSGEIRNKKQEIKDAAGSPDPDFTVPAGFSFP